MGTAKMSQTDILLQHFKRVPNISAMEAWHVHRIRSLSRRINDLEDLGYAFRRERKIDTAGQRYVRYHFQGKKG
jgi:hypothetical protein